MHWLYYQYIPEGKEFPILCKKLDAESKGWMKTVSSYMISVSKEEQVLLDWNGIAERHVSRLCFRLRTSEMTVFCQPLELKGFLVWNGLKILVLSSIHYLTRTNSLTGLCHQCNQFADWNSKIL
ncbi:uncharacterized protein LOC124895622 [Capsicum annuum]|uniref:uncharacterized protein LOC124895622 n=1 Tax=Capsicum annuum TaxID=4072 RepID=UPI001FB12A4C|nr:uncharacterized protein LOC124895622 [Capsicum annuum]